MSNAVFPTLAGLTWNVLKSPRWSSKVQQSVGGKEMRAAYWTTPLYTWTLTYELLRASAMLELQSLIGFFNARQGKFDSFLFSDPSDNNVTSHGFGVGDGVKTAFQLQRSLAGPRTLDFSGVQNFYSTPRTNLQPWSERMDQWIPRSGSVSSTQTVAPDGSVSAYMYVPDGASVYIGATVIAGDWNGRTFTVSVWLKSSVGNRTVIFGLLRNSDAVSLTTSVTITPQWQRYTMTGTGPDPSSGFEFFMQESGGSLVSWSAWGAQVEAGTVATPYIKTAGAAAVTVAPSYWPASGDAFEPVLDLAPSPTIYRTDWQGQQQLYPTARTNLCPNSEALNTGWVPRSGTVTADATVAPDGTSTADQYNPGGAAGYIVQQLLTTNGNGRTFTVSVWLKAISAAAKSVTFGLLKESDGPTGITTTVPISQVWQRYTITLPVVGATTTLWMYLQEASGNSTAFYAWGMQVEEAPALTSYIKTTSAAVTRTDYTLGGTGLVTLAVAPLLNAALLWTGSYYWRVRFADDLTEFNNFLSQLWEAKKVSLVSVKAA